MDIVQRQQEQKRLISAGIWPIWTQFKASLVQILQSYEKSSRDVGWSARLDSVHDKSVVITQSRGVAHDGFHNQALSITIAIRESEPVAITVAVEEYIERAGAHSVQKSEKSEYLISADIDSGECRLTMRGTNPMTPSEAVDHLIGKTILKT